MGFYIRKAFNWGPFRLNLSKGGAGFSFRPLPGLRIGRDAKGRWYYHFGFFGFYYRGWLSRLVEKGEQPPA